MRLKGLKVGQIVQVEFTDHSQGDGEVEPVDCIVWGKVTVNKPAYIKVTVWESDEIHNCDAYCIVKSAIKTLKVIGS